MSTTQNLLSPCQAVALHALTQAEYNDLAEMARRIPELLVDDFGNYYRQPLQRAVRMIRDGRASRVTAPRSTRQGLRI
jgi:uncharacterized protein YbgA (DUF1722 family)